MRHRPRAARTLTVAAAALALLGTTASPGHAGLDPGVVTDGLITPLSVAVADDGTVYVAQNFAGMLTRVPTTGDPETVFTHPEGSEVGAVSVSGAGVVFATTGGTRKAPNADLWRLEGDGGPVRLANLQRHEKRHNPDAGVRYGIGKIGPRCAEQLPPGVAPYSGIVEAHPYATAVDGAVTYVADAAGNSVLRVGSRGRVRTVAVLPPTRIEVTRKLKRAFDLPGCTIGKNYRAEGVPTDVEIGADGNLYVTSLPGGPEDPRLGANGSVYRITPAGEVRKVVRGLMSPVGLAIAPNGDFYVSMLFASAILKVPAAGTRETFAEVPLPGDVEYADGALYATETDLMAEGRPDGKVWRWSLPAG